MGNSFAERSGVTKEIQIQNHLKFIIDNFHLIKLAFKDIKEVKYIIVAIYSPEIQDKSNEICKDDIDLLKEGVNKLSKIALKSSEF